MRPRGASIWNAMQRLQRLHAISETFYKNSLYRNFRENGCNRCNRCIGPRPAAPPTDRRPGIPREATGDARHDARRPTPGGRTVRGANAPQALSYIPWAKSRLGNAFPATRINRPPDLNPADRPAVGGDYRGR